MISFTALIWTGFLVLVTAVIALDLGVFHRKSHVISLPEALGWTAVWVSLALAFNVGVYFLYELNPSGWDMDTSPLSGSEAAIQFFTGYLVEKSLSIDNVFVIAMIFTCYRIPLEEQHRVLFWGIFGAIVLRGIMIFGGIALLERFTWLTYVLGAVLLWSAAKVMVLRNENVNVEQRLTVRMIKRFVPVTDRLHGSRFFVQEGARTVATPLFVTLVLVEISDLVFAIDSIPAIFAITRDSFIVFTSNIFAILGLRSLYFVLAGLMDRFRYLKRSLAYLLAYIGVKMMLVHTYPIPNQVSLAIIGGILAVGILASTAAARDAYALLSPVANELESLAVASYRQARRAVILVIGASVLLIGIAMIVLPGPAILVIPLGLTILGIEFAWARHWLKSMKKSVDDTRKSLGI
jgi:tellurite resistance protein TerC